MAYRTINLDGTYEVAASTKNSITLVSPALVNPSWLYVDLNGSGSTGYDQNITLTEAGSSQAVDLSGTYVVAAVTPTQITLTNPQAVKADWASLNLFAGNATRALSAYVANTSASNWIGPFIVEAADTAVLIANFIAQQGLFKDNGKKQIAFPVTIELEATPVDSNELAIGPAQVFSTTLPGNATGRDTRAISLVCQLTQPGRQSVRARRTTNADYVFEGTVVDEVKWQDLYGASAVDAADFGDVTTVRSRTYATEGALSAKERKLNMVVTRKIPTRIAGTNFTAPAPSSSAADIFTAVCRDPFIGGRQLEELDLDSIYSAVAGAVAYFGSPDAGEFGFTFDDDNLSFEETASIIAQAAFSTAYRQGSLIRLLLERSTEDSTLLFNHRNKVPGSETRTVRFGPLDNNDGVELSYTAPEDGAPVTIYIPADKSAKKPRAVAAYGIRSHQQAYWQAWRAYNKLRYQHITTEFTALQEAAVVIRNERVLVADNTRPDTQDGEVTKQTGLEITLSQEVDISSGSHSIFLQLHDGTVESMPISAGSAANRVILARAPLLPLALEDELYARTVYQIVGDNAPGQSAFLIATKEGQDNFNYRIQAINYSGMYYANDQLLVWLNFANGYLDGSPWLADAVPVGGSAIITDATRGKVHAGGTAADIVNLAQFGQHASYTKAFWARRVSVFGGGSVLSSTSTYERVAFSSTGLSVFHGVAGVAAAWPGGADEWHHVAATYDADVSELTLYIDGEQVAAATAVPQRQLGFLHAVGFNGGDGFPGRLGDVRLVSRALGPDEVRALYRATKL